MLTLQELGFHGSGAGLLVLVQFEFKSKNAQAVQRKTAKPFFPNSNAKILTS